MKAMVAKTMTAFVLVMLLLTVLWPLQRMTIEAPVPASMTFTLAFPVSVSWTIVVLLICAVFANRFIGKIAKFGLASIVGDYISLIVGVSLPFGIAVSVAYALAGGYLSYGLNGTLAEAACIGGISVMVVAIVITFTVASCIGIAMAWSLVHKWLIGRKNKPTWWKGTPLVARQ